MKIIVSGDSLEDGGRGNPSCAEHQNLEFAAGQAYFCGKKGRYVVITVDTGDSRSQIFVQEMLVNPSNQSKTIRIKQDMKSVVGLCRKNGLQTFFDHEFRQKIPQPEIFSCIFVELIKMTNKQRKYILSQYM